MFLPLTCSSNTAPPPLASLLSGVSKFENRGESAGTSVECRTDSNLIVPRRLRTASTVPKVQGSANLATSSADSVNQAPFG